MSQSDDSHEKCYTPDEIVEILENLDAVDLTKIKQIVSIRARVFKYDNNELLNEVIEKILSGERHWPRSINIYQLFSELSKSILSNYMKKVSRELSLDSLIEDFGEKNEAVEREKQKLEEKEVLEEMKDHIFSEFENDQDAIDIIMLKMDGEKKSAILEYLEISDTEYESKMRKIKRRLDKRTQGSVV